MVVYVCFLTLLHCDLRLLFFSVMCHYFIPSCKSTSCSFVKYGSLKSSGFMSKLVFIHICTSLCFFLLFYVFLLFRLFFYKLVSLFSVISYSCISINSSLSSNNFCRMHSKAVVKSILSILLSSTTLSICCSLSQ